MKLRDETVYVDKDGRHLLSSNRMLRRTHLVAYLFMLANFLYHVSAAMGIVVAFLYAGEPGRWVAYVALAYAITKAIGYTLRQANQKELNDKVNHAIDINAVRKLPTPDEK